MWDNTSIDIGNVEPSSTHEVEFNYTGDKKILTVTTGCGCTKTFLEDNILTLKVTVPKKSNSVTSNYSFNTSAIVSYDDSTKQRLSVKATY